MTYACFIMVLPFTQLFKTTIRTLPYQDYHLSFMHHYECLPKDKNYL